MKKDNKFFEDFGKLASSAFASAATMRRELSEYIRQYIESFVKKMDFVSKDELEVVKKIALQTDKELQQLKKKLNLEEEKPAKKQEKSKVVKPKAKSSTVKKP